jgi:hypothetical protein
MPKKSSRSYLTLLHKPYDVTTTYLHEYLSIDNAIAEGDMKAVKDMLDMRDSSLITNVDYVAKYLGERNLFIKEFLAIYFPGISRSLIYSYVAYGAARGGHLFLVMKMIENGAVNYNNIAAHAASKGHIEIVDKMIVLGANDLNSIAQEAAYGGYGDIVEAMITEGHTLHSSISPMMSPPISTNIYQ